MKHQKNMLCLGLAAVLSLSLLTACSGGNSAATPAPADTTAPTDTAAPADTTAPAGFTTVEEGKLHMSTNAAFPPYEMTTDAGGFEGIDVEVALSLIHI